MLDLFDRAVELQLLECLLKALGLDIGDLVLERAAGIQRQ